MLGVCTLGVVRIGRVGMGVRYLQVSEIIARLLYLSGS
jgi:hypothetical protein